jgi:hypothetical protein
VAHCRVSFTGSDGTVHLVTVEADSLYEAIGLAVAEFRADKLTETPGPMTEFTVAIERPPVEHRIRFIQVAKWAERTAADGPAGMVKRQRVKDLPKPAAPPRNAYYIRHAALHRMFCLVY